MKDIKISKSSSSFARKHNIKVSSYRQLSNFVKNIDSDYLEENGEAECLSFLFDIVEGSRSEYGNLLLNELRYLFDCNDELVGTRLIFNMLLNRDLNDLIKRTNFKNINRMLNIVAKNYINDKTYYLDYRSSHFSALTKMSKRVLKSYLNEYMDGDGGYYTSYSIEGLKKVLNNVIKEFILFNTGVYKQVLNYQINFDDIERFKEKHLEDFDDIFSRKLEDAIMSFENTVDSQVYDYGTMDDVEEYEQKMSDVSVDTGDILQAYQHMMNEIYSFKMSKDMVITDITTEIGMFKMSKYMDKEVKKIIKSFIEVLEVELNSYIEETDLTLDVLSCEYVENVVSNVIFTLVLNNILMFIFTEPLNNRTGKAILQRLTREVGFLNLLNDSLDIAFDINTDDYIRTDWCE